MQIKVSWCRKPSQCSWCEETIKPPEPIVHGIQARPGKYAARFRWHIECWVESVMDYLSRHPTRERLAGPGRPPLGISSEDTEERKMLLGRGCAIRQRIRYKVSRGKTDIAELSQHLLDIGEELEQLGGRPKRWK